MSEVLVDTGPLVGWINKRDQWHDWSVSVLSDLVPPLMTCEAVIAEAVWHLHSSQIAVDQLYGLVSGGALRIVDLLPDHVLHIRALSAKYPEIDFCDAAMVRLSEIFPKAKLISTDTAHFQIYRRFQNQNIPLIHP